MESKLKKIVIDPVTRIEGHLRIEVEVDENNIVQEAWASGQLFRGIETILKGRDPRDTGLIAQRICGVCTNSHYRASIAASENAYDIKIPKNAKIIRDLISLSLFIQDHIVHYYHLHSLDFVDVASATKADAQLALDEAYNYCEKPYKNSLAHLEYVKEKITNFVKAGRMGLFANGYWGHNAYKFTPEQNLIHMSHYLEALEIQREVAKAVAIFGGKNPHPQYLTVGGITSVADILNPQRINDFVFILKNAHDFIKRAYIPDMKMLVKVYKDDIKEKKGRGLSNFMSVGGYSFSNDIELFESGVIRDFDLENIEEFDINKVTEEACRAWYENDEKVYPSKGETKPFYTDLNEDGTLKTQGKYSWIKAPRYDSIAMEVGPLSRMLVGYAKNSKVIKPYMQEFMEENDLEILDFATAIGRNAARAIESLICCEFIFDFTNDLIENLKYYDEETWTKFDFDKLPSKANGYGLFEVPRGVLCHFVNIEDKKVSNYQAVVPTTWNASSKDEFGNRGSYEEALLGLKIEDLEKPLEVLRVVHSFDPCIACAVHIIDTNKKDLGVFKAGKIF